MCKYINIKLLLIIIIFMFISMLFGISTKQNQKMEELKNAQNPKVTIEAKNEDIKVFFNRLQEKSSVYILLSEEIKGKVNINVKNTRLKDVFDKILISKGYYFGLIESIYMQQFKGKYRYGYYISTPNIKNINPRILKNGKDWPDNVNERTLKDMKKQSIEKEFWKKYFVQYLAERRKEEHKKRQGQRKLEFQKEEEELRKAGKILNMESKIFYDKTSTKNIKKMNVIENNKNISIDKKKIEYKSSKASFGFISSNDNIKLETDNSIEKKYERILCKKIVVYDTNYNIINVDTISNGYISLSENGENYGKLEYINNNKHKFIYKNKNGTEIFTKNYDYYPGDSPSFYLNYNFGFYEATLNYINIYNNKGNQIISLQTDMLYIWLIAVSDNRHYFLINEGVKIYHVYNIQGNEIYWGKLPERHMFNYGVIDNIGNIYLSISKDPVSFKNGITEFYVCNINQNSKLVWKRSFNRNTIFKLVNNDKYIFVFENNNFYLLNSSDGSLISSVNMDDEFKNENISINVFPSNPNTKLLYNNKNIIMAVNTKEKVIIYVFDYNLNIANKIIHMKNKQNIIAKYKLIKNSFYLMLLDGITKYDL